MQIAFTVQFTPVYETSTLVVRRSLLIKINTKLYAFVSSAIVFERFRVISVLDVNVHQLI